MTPLTRECSPGVQRVAVQLVETLEQRANLDVVRLEPPKGIKLGRWRNSLAKIEREKSLHGVHSFLSAFAALPVRNTGKRVQTVHELPWKHGVQENAGWRHRVWARVGAARADAIIVPSQHVFRDLGKPGAAEGGKVHVIPWGVETRFAPEPEPGQIDEILLERYRLPEGPFLLCLGAVRPKKNLPALLHALAHLKERGPSVPHVVVTGPNTESLRRDLGLVSKLGLARFVSTPGEIEDEDLPGILRLAAAVPVLSHSEGYALPVLEALACGTPVIVPPDSAQSEVAAGLGIEVQPSDPAAVAQALRQAIEEREDLRWTLPDAAEGRTWDAAAQAVEGVWESLA